MVAGVYSTRRLRLLDTVRYKSLNSADIAGECLRMKSLIKIYKL